MLNALEPGRAIGNRTISSIRILKRGRRCHRRQCGIVQIIIGNLRGFLGLEKVTLSPRQIVVARRRRLLGRGMAFETILGVRWRMWTNDATIVVVVAALLPKPRGEIKGRSGRLGWW